MIKRLIVVLILAAASAALVCGVALLVMFKIGGGVLNAKSDSEDVARGYSEAVRNKEFDNAAAFYSPGFFRQTSREEWLQTLKKINQKLGDLQTYELQTWNVREWVGPQGSGTYYVFQYKVTYSRHSATEILTLFKPTGGRDIRILGHDINSQGLLE